VLVDPAFLQARSARYGGVGAPSVSRSGSTVEVRTIRQLPLDHVPSAFRRFVGDGRVEQVDRWQADGAPDVTGVWVLETGRAPIELHGEHVVSTDRSGSRYVVTANIRVTVPVVAGRLSRQVESYLSQLIASEQKFLAEWLTA
jgi:Protein of unknown function (DUF2505)